MRSTTRRTIGATVLVALTIAALSVAASARPAYLEDRREGDDPRSILWEPKQAAFEKMQAATALPPDPARASQDDYDAYYYDIDIEIEDGPETVAGSVVMRGTNLVSNLTAVILNLYDNLTVDSVALDGAPASFTHQNDLLTVTTNGLIAPGATFEVDVVYHGAPIDDALNFSSHDGWPIISSLSEPIGARQWWPCKDTPADKADSARIALTVDDALVAVSNGMLESEVDNGTTKTYTWVERYPITTYLVSVAISNYSLFTDYYTYGRDTMPIENFVYPEHLSDAQEDLNITADAIGILADAFGPYPFLNERYGHAVFPWGGAMEHQTCTSYGEVLIRGDHYYDWILVHELGHQWWGDWVTCGTWLDIWLNEGFASYSEALYFEALGGESEYDDYVQAYDAYGYFNGPIYDPDSTFNRTVYDKGALVLHMLRRVMEIAGGPVDHYPLDSLQAVLADYGSTYAYQSPVTPDFQAVCEAHYGGSLDWFFLPWVYGENRPDYRWSWIASDQGPPYGVMIHVEQVQSDAGLFTMPIDFKIHTTAGDELVVGWNDALEQDFFFDAGAPVTGVSFDPGNWILKYISQNSTGLEDAVPTTVALSSAGRGVGSSAELAFALPSDGRVSIDLYDVTGRLVTTLIDEVMPAGTHSVTWDGTDRSGASAASGVYFARLNSRDGAASAKIMMLR